VKGKLKQTIMMDQDQIEKEKSKGTKSVHFQTLDQIKIEQEVELETLFEKDLEDFMAMNPTSIIQQLEKFAETFPHQDPSQFGSKKESIELSSFFQPTSATNTEVENTRPLLGTGPLLSKGAYATPDEFSIPYHFRIPDYVKDKLAETAKTTKNILGLGREEPLVGVTIYIGSPVNGDMLVCNPKIVNEWLKYIRAAQTKKLIKPQGGLVSTAELEKLCKVTILPEGRHRFSIGYDMHPEISCNNHGHCKFLWQSQTYPCAVVSCGCPKLINNDGPA
jgi:hypothetical protein